MTARNLQPLPVRRLPLSGVLRQLAEESGRERISLQDLFQALGDRALAALLFFFAIPNVIPSPPGLSSVLGVPLVILSAQLLTGRKAWLPVFVAQRSMAREDFQALITRALPWLERAEKLLRPRLSAIALPPMEYLLGFVCMILAVVLALPIPLGNIPPAFAIALIALGILERDGMWVLAGLVVAAVSLTIVWGVVLAIVKVAAALLAAPFQ
ncbi:MAG: exopolysaccharide biosynthesis protein [Steroidobacteraceae bacterium]